MIGAYEANREIKTRFGTLRYTLRYIIMIVIITIIIFVTFIIIITIPTMIIIMNIIIMIIICSYSLPATRLSNMIWSFETSLDSRWLLISLVIIWMIIDYIIHMNGYWLYIDHPHHHSKSHQGLTFIQDCIIHLQKFRRPNFQFKLTSHQKAKKLCFLGAEKCRAQPEHAPQVSLVHTN